MKEPFPLRVEYCEFCASILKVKYKVHCSEYCHKTSKAIKKRERFTMEERLERLKLNGTNEAYKEAIKLVNNKL